MASFTIFAGINGAGKSTLYDFQKSIGNPELGIRICPDEILESDHGDWKSNHDVFSSGQKTIAKIHDCINSQISFNWETTSVGRIGEKFIEEAREKGFEVHLNFVGVDDVEESLKRIRFRVQCGGHGVHEDIVRSRYFNQSKGLAKALPLVDTAILFSNKDTLEIVATYFDEKLHIYDPTPSWIQDLATYMNPDNIVNECEIIDNY